MSQMVRAALANLRIWWPEALWAAFATFTLGMHQYDGLAYVIVFSVISWTMGYRHRLLPLLRKIDRIGDGVSEILDDVRAKAEPAQDDDAQPRLRLVRRD